MAHAFPLGGKIIVHGRAPATAQACHESAAQDVERLEERRKLLRAAQHARQCARSSHCPRRRRRGGQAAAARGALDWGRLLTGAPAADAALREASLRALREELHTERPRRPALASLLEEAMLEAVGLHRMRTTPPQGMKGAWKRLAPGIPNPWIMRGNPRAGA